MALRLTRRDEILNESGISAVSKRAVAVKTLWGEVAFGEVGCSCSFT